MTHRNIPPLYQSAVEWGGRYHADARVSVIADDATVSLLFHGHGYSLTPPDLTPEACRALATALAAAADALDAATVVKVAA